MGEVLMNEDRCSEMEQHMDDVRAGLIETRADIKQFGESLGRVERKVFNGFGSRIEAVNDKLDDEKRANAENHKAMQDSINSMTRFVSGALITIFVGMLGLFGVIWTTGSRAEMRVQELEHTVIETLLEYNREVQHEIEVIQSE